MRPLTLPHYMAQDAMAVFSHGRARRLHHEAFGKEDRLVGQNERALSLPERHTRRISAPSRNSWQGDAILSLCSPFVVPFGSEIWSAHQFGKECQPNRGHREAHISQPEAAVRIPRESGRYLVGLAQLREQFEMGNIASQPQEFVSGFVDFLLGRRPPPSMIPPRPSSSGLLPVTN